MRPTIPQVRGDRLYRSEAESDPMVLGSSEWYAWLEQSATFTFVDSTGTFTARKIMLRTGDSYWKAYCRRQGKLYRIHLGHAHTLTLEKLQAAARAFAGEHGSRERADASRTQSTDSSISMHMSPRKALILDHPMALLQTKLFGPRKRSDLIDRARLIERLNMGLSGTVTLVTAPAGFGKTTLIAQWMQSINHPSAWLSLDEHDNELRVFVRSLTASLQTVFPDMFHGLDSLSEASRFPTLEQIVSLFINDLADLPDDLILALDDYHLMRTRDIHSLLELLIEHLPPQLHVVLISRSDPPLPVHRWQALGYLNDLRPTDLLFTLEETEAFLHQELGQRVAREAAASLEDRTGGWVALLRLAVLSLRNTSDVMAFLDQLPRVADYSIQRYLVEEVLAQFAPAMQALLEKTSVLEQFSAALCTSILGSDTSYEHVQATLDWLERSNLFVVPLDERKGWYRFHHLFGQLFQQHLQAHSSAEELATLHRRASAWYAEQELIDQAINHALKAGDVLGATSLVEAHFLSAFEREQLMQIDYWLHLLPEEQIQGSPLLLVARAWRLQNRGQLKDIPRLLTTAERLVAASESRDDRQRRGVRALIAILWSQIQFFTGQVQVSLESASFALALLQEGDEYVASVALLYQAWSRQANGQEEAALAALNHALRERATHLDGTARLLFAQAWIYLAAGKLHQVEHTARHLLQVAQEASIPLSQNFAHWLLGVVSYEWNHLDAAVYHFSAVIANQYHAHFWAVEEALRGLALAYRAQDSSSQAQESARALLELVQEQHNMEDLMTAYAFCGRIALMQDDVEQAEQWLEMAGEQEVRGPMMFLEAPPITKAWLLLAKGDEVSAALGQALVTHLLHHVEVMHDTRKMIQVLALQAWAFDLQGRENEALEVLERALALARPAEFIRTFADLPALAKLLNALRKRRKSQEVLDRKFDTYVQHILSAMNSRTTPLVSNEPLLQQEGLETLTDRELHILRLLEKDFTNKEIARELVVTTGTVKVHTNNVYRKLSVNNRRAAVSLAKALGLLTAS
jgi:LuxR family transcriptional regulator, maltose regulon positive regulatory protein